MRPNRRALPAARHRAPAGPGRRAAAASAWARCRSSAPTSRATRASRWRCSRARRLGDARRCRASPGSRSRPSTTGWRRAAFRALRRDARPRRACRPSLAGAAAGRARPRSSARGSTAAAPACTPASSLGTCLLVFAYGRAAAWTCCWRPRVTARRSACSPCALLGIAGRLARARRRACSRASPRWPRVRSALLLPALVVGRLRRWPRATGGACARLALARRRSLLFAGSWPRPGTSLVLRAQGRAFVDVFLLNHNVAALHVAPIHRHPGPVVYYLPVLLAGLFPWAGLLVPALAAVRAAARRADLFVLSGSRCRCSSSPLAGSKLPGYILPCLPPLALLIGRAADRLVHGDAPCRGGAARARRCSRVVLGALVAAVPARAARAWASRAGRSRSRSRAWCAARGARRSRARIGRRPGGRAAPAARGRAPGCSCCSTGAAPPHPRARASRAATCSCPPRGREVLAWGAWRTAWMAGYFYNDGARARGGERWPRSRQRPAAGPALVVCGPAERRIARRGARPRARASSPRARAGNALVPRRIRPLVLVGTRFTILHDRAAPRRERVRHLVHERPHEEDAAAVGLQQVLLGQGVGHGAGVEAGALVLHPHLERGGCEREDRRATRLLSSPLVAVLDRVHDRLAHGHAHVVRGVLVEADASPRGGRGRSAPSPACRSGWRCRA